MPELTLFDDQGIAFSAIQKAFREGHKKILLYACTGWGKTELGIFFMDAAQKNNKKSSFMVDRIVLCIQTSERLDKYSVDHGVEQAKHPRYLPEKFIQVCSVQTLEKKGTLPNSDLIIIDEAHCQRKIITEFVKNTDKYVIGLSASPFTKGMGQIYDHVVSTTTYKELIDKKRLVPLKVYIGQEIDMEGAKKTAGEWTNKEVTERGHKIIGDVVSEWVDKTNLHFSGPVKTIVFCAGVNHGRELEDQFQAAGYNFLNISYRDRDDYKEAVLKEFSKPDTDIQGLIATDILTKGFDCADVMCGVSVRPFSKSFSSHVQQMGRVMRSFPGKEFALWLDHSGNFLRFWDDWHYLYHNGVKTLDYTEKPKKEPDKKKKEKAKCPVCQALWMGGDTCYECGWIRPNNHEMISTPGELIEFTPVNKTKKYSQEEKQDWYSQILDYAINHKTSKGQPFSEGWSYHMFKEKFHVAPNYKLRKIRKPCGQEVSDWIVRRITHQRIKWAKSRHRAQSC